MSYSMLAKSHKELNYFQLHTLPGTEFVTLYQLMGLILVLTTRQIGK